MRRKAGLVQTARSQGNTFFEVRPCCSRPKRCQGKVFRPRGLGALRRQVLPWSEPCRKALGHLAGKPCSGIVCGRKSTAVHRIPDRSPRAAPVAGPVGRTSQPRRRARSARAPESAPRGASRSVFAPRRDRTCRSGRWSHGPGDRARRPGSGQKGDSVRRGNSRTARRRSPGGQPADPDIRADGPRAPAPEGRRGRAVARDGRWRRGLRPARPCGSGRGSGPCGCDQCTRRGSRPGAEVGRRPSGAGVLL
jgi:hypothetical protein